MASTSFDSYSQNGEDVVLWRALRGILHGRYIDVGANDPAVYSVSRAFYNRGWSGITVEPDPQFAALQREARPRDHLVEAAITAQDGGFVTFHVVDGTGLSTIDDELLELHTGSGYDAHDIVVPTRRLDRILTEAGWAGSDIHFMSVDTEGSERAVLESIDLSVWRPWVLIIEATVPLSTTPSYESWDRFVTEAGYHFTLFDGLSRWYVADEHLDSLGPAFAYGASVVDDYTTLQSRQYVEKVEEMQAALDEAIDDTARWRSQALTRWAGTVIHTMRIANLQAELDALRGKHHELLGEHHELSQLCHQLSLQTAVLNEELSSVRESTSWRITEPLRAAVGTVHRVRRRL